MNKYLKNLKSFLCFLLLSMLGLTSCGGVPGQTTDQTASAEPTSPGTPSPEPSPEPTPDCAPDEPPVEVVVGEVRVQLLTNSLLRVEVKDGDSFEDRPSFSVPTRTGWKKVAYTLRDEDGGKAIVTKNYIVHLPENAKSLSRIYVTDTSGNELWRYETMTDSRVYLPSPGDELACWYFSDSPRVIPSEYGYSLPEDGSYEKDNGWEFHKAAKDMFVFLPHGDYKTFTSDFVKLTGRSEMLPLDLFGYWDSRWYAYSEETALQQIQDYKDKGYSIDVLVIDTDWRKTSGGIGYEINTDLFPNMARFLEKAHEAGVSVYFNDHPEPYKGTKSLLDEKEIDYRTKNLKLLLSLGLDYWWYDRNWSVALKPITDGLSIYTTGMYAFQWITEDYYESIVDDLQTYARRGLIMGNVDGINNGVLTHAPELASHRYSLQWTGDINTDGYALSQEIYDMVFGGAELGLPYMSSDLGGHTSATTNDMYVRWIQYGALSNIMRVHCTKPYSRMPWLYGDTAEAVTKEYVGMRYRLLPLFYALAHENYTTGLPLMRRPDINYPQYAESSANDEYLLGDYILVAPISGAQKTAPVPDAWLSHDGEPGLLGEYFKNSGLHNRPALTRVDSNIDFDWSNQKMPELGIAENYSARWTGQITVGDEDILLRFYADDGVRVFIDGKKVLDGWKVYDQYLFTDGVLEAHTTHDIRVDYCQYGGYAHIRMAYTTKLDDAREVFLPDGEWIDVWSGERTGGPTTVKVSHPLETSPIYVRAGAVIPLAENMVNTKEKNWSNMALDVYPSMNFDASTVIYEDDTRTVAYKDGKFRETTVSTAFADGALALRIGAAKGSFEDDFRAFDERTFTVRVHGREDWGEVTKVARNGETVAATVYPLASDASPFAYTGGARDGKIYEIVFTTKVAEENEILVFFDHPQPDKVNESYDRASVSFTAEVGDLSKGRINLGKSAELDYAYFGWNGANSVLRQKDGAKLIGDLSTDGELAVFDDNHTVVWSGGDVKESGISTSGVLSARNFRQTLQVPAGKTVFTFYVGGWRSAAKFTVRDRAGHVRTLSFGNIGTNFYKKITLVCEAEKETELYINYALMCGSNVTFTAVQAAKG